MCGRFTLHYDGDLAEYYGVPAESFIASPNYNITPGMNVPVIIQKEERKIRPMRWGLVPHWAKDEKIGYTMINARSESVFEKATFRKPIQSSRVVIPASGFYEWKKTEGGKQPYYFKPKDDELFSLAGISDTWKSKEGSDLQTFSILTTSPNTAVEPVHNRMPVTLAQDEIDTWISKDSEESDIKKLLDPYTSEMVSYQVSLEVNSPQSNFEELIHPVDAQSGLFS